MPTPFPHTTRALAADRPRPLLAATATGLLLLAAWSLWLLRADITLYKTSASARLEQDDNSVQISAQRGGKILAVAARLGDTLAAGDIVVQLDASPAQLQRAGEIRVSASLETELEAIKRERQLLDAQYQKDHEARAAELERLRQLHQLQESNLAIQTDVADRFQKLAQKQQAAQLDYLRAKRDRQQALMTTLEARSAVEAAETRQRRGEQEYQRALAALAQRSSQIRRQIQEADTRLQQHSLAVEEQHLRAPIAGTLSSLAELRPGQVLAAGQVVGAIRADGGLRVSALYNPADALGHIRPGQPARVELQGFSRARYGQIRARVTRVASAVQDGRIAVELRIDDPPPAGLPLLHDLPARVEVATASISPWQLLLQRAGRLLAPQEAEMEATLGAGQ
ncbi:HlyD family secretion protein [Microbulbifer sp. TYP-18]|uniref:HlyD family secretion protein n=1 Tax=Microbulbifer sp. TYP-18 TaxID=3230024 RepID=UPI0034C5E29E